MSITIIIYFIIRHENNYFSFHTRLFCQLALTDCAVHSVAFLFPSHTIIRAFIAIITYTWSYRGVFTHEQYYYKFLYNYITLCVTCDVTMIPLLPYIIYYLYV